jgi:3-deoxy-D-manno-octulosonate 8-phosphate phosphatase (KDO 8-P phosphatase)
MSPANPTLSPELLQRMRCIKLMIFDVDGVLTDGGLRFGAEGELIKTFNVLDGQGIRTLQKFSVDIAIISARQSPLVSRRAADLGIQWVMQGVHDKRSGFEQLLAQTAFTAADCGFMGDDVIDLPVMTRVSFAASVPNGHPEARARAHYVTQASGGRGAAREVCDLILRAQGNYEAALAPYLA